MKPGIWSDQSFFLDESLNSLKDEIVKSFIDWYLYDFIKKDYTQ